MALQIPSIPSGFIDLANASRAKVMAEQYNVIGVCTKVLDPFKTSKDWKLEFTLHDPMWSGGIGMDFVFFTSKRERLPEVREAGDVVILRNIKSQSRKGFTQGLSNATSTWVVLPFTEVLNINNAQGLAEKARYQKDNRTKDDKSQYPYGAQAALPNIQELQYAKWIAEQEDPNTWPAVQPRTAAEVAATMVSNGGSAPPPKQKHRNLEDLTLSGVRHTFVDLVGEVRRVFANDFLTELYITDYTTNEQLYDYRPKKAQGGRDGDPYGYIKDNSTEWPGPWGQMAITVCCRDRQSYFANAHVKLGSFVSIRNVQIKIDSNGSKLEGNCRDDPQYPDKEMITVLKKPENDEKLLALITRKRQYEEYAGNEGLSFLRHPAEVPKRKQREEKTEQEQPPTKKSRKNRNRKAKLHAEQEGKQESVTPKQMVKQKLEDITRINQYGGGIYSNKTVVDILELATLDRTTAKGNYYRLPFQNCTYKSKVRVVDFYPDNIADFAVPRRISQYGGVPGYDSSDESEVDIENAGKDIQWEWRFVLLIEDAKHQPNSTTPTQMELLVAEGDGDRLLNMDACDLRHEDNQKELAKLKEKLFLLWGDLQEEKEEQKDKENADEDVQPCKSNSRPFDCLIKEYGVPSWTTTKSRNGGAIVYDRMFRMFGTNIT